MKRLLVPILSLLSLALAAALLLTQVARTNLEQENAFLHKQLQSFTDSRDELTHSSVVRVADPVPETAADELARLRGEVSNLRREQQQLEKLRVENQTLRAQSEAARAEIAKANASAPQPAITHSRENWSFTGYADPESALQSLLWAGANGNAAALIASLTPEQLARMRTEDSQNRTDEEVAQRLAQQIAKVKSFQVLESRNIAENETVLTLYIDGLEGSEKTPRMRMHLVDGQWRLAGPYNPEQPKQQ